MPAVALKQAVEGDECGEVLHRRRGVGGPGCEGLSIRKTHFQAGQRRTCQPRRRGLVGLDVRDPPYARRISRRGNTRAHLQRRDGGVAQRAQGGDPHKQHGSDTVRPAALARGVHQVHVFFQDGGLH